MSRTAETFYSLVGTRRSIRRFHAAPVPETTIRRILEAAILAPSAHNRQPWRFVVVQGAESQARLVDAMGKRLRRDLEADAWAQDAIDEKFQRSRARILGAPVVIVICLARDDVDKNPDAHRSQAEHTMAVQSVAMAGGLALQAAHAEGLGACWICAPLFAPEEVRKSMDLPDSWEPQGLIILGEPAEQGRDKEMRSLGEVALWR